MKDDELFTTNVAKDGLMEKRQKLAADRFKQKNKDGILKSKTEVALIKKLWKKNPPEPVKKEVEVFDVWADNSGPSKKIQKYKNFTKKSMTKINALVTPLSGQSINPALSSHREVLKKVVVEEEKELEDNYRGTMAHALREAAAAMDILEAKKAERQEKALAQAKNGVVQAEEDDESEESDSDEESGSESQEGAFKPIDRRKKLTKQQRNEKARRKEKVLAQ